MTRTIAGFFITAVACLFLAAIPVTAIAQQRGADPALHYVANTRPPDAYLALRTQPSSSIGARIATMPNGTAVRILERRNDGWWRVRVQASGQEGWALAYQGNRTWIECCITATVANPPPSEALEMDGFKTPSGNIHCQSFASETADGKPSRALRCDIRDMSNRPPPRPRDCDLDWGQAFEVTVEAKAGERICHGDTAMDATLRVLPYGATWQRDGLRCTSDQRGVNCANPQGHGFELSRSAQRVF